MFAAFVHDPTRLLVQGITAVSLSLLAAVASGSPESLADDPMPPNGTEGAGVIATHQSATLEIDPSASAEYLYVIDLDMLAIRKIRTDGSSDTTIVAGLTVPQSVAVDERRGWLYWADTAEQNISRVRLDGSDRSEVFADPSTFPQGLDVNVETGELVWSDPLNRTINMLDPETGASTTIVTLAAGPFDVAVDPSRHRVLWMIPNQGVFASDFSGSAIEYITPSFSGQSTVLAAAPDLGRVLYASALRLRAADFESTCPLTFNNPLVENNVTGVAFDPSTSSVFWSHPVAGEVLGATVSGSGLVDVETIVAIANPGRLDTGPGIAAPSFESIPDARALNGGETLTLSAPALGSPPLRYRWHRDGFPVLDGIGTGGASSPTLTVQQISPDKAGVYTCTVTGPGGTITTPPIVVAVRPVSTFAPSVNRERPHPDINGDGEVDAADLRAMIAAIGRRTSDQSDDEPAQDTP